MVFFIIYAILNVLIYTVLYTLFPSARPYLSLASIILAIGSISALSFLAQKSIYKVLHTTEYNQAEKRLKRLSPYLIVTAKDFVHSLRPMIQFLQGNYAEANIYLDKILPTLTDSTLQLQSLNLKGLALYFMGNQQEGLNYFQKALQLDSKIPFPEENLAAHYLHQHDTESALPYIEMAIKKWEGTKDQYLTGTADLLLAWALAQNGKREDALATLDMAFKKDKAEIRHSSAEYHYLAGRVYEELGDSGKAKAYWEKSSALDAGHYGEKARQTLKVSTF